MKQRMYWLVFALATVAAVSPAHAEDKWMDGTVTYKIGGVDTAFKDPADACKAGVALLAKQGNKKTYVSVKEGTSTTMMTCVVKETSGSLFEQQNIITKVLNCPATTTAKSTDNSGKFSSIRCHCDGKECPKAGAAAPDVKPADPKPAVAGNWVDGKVGYRIGGVDKVFTVAADACKAGVAELVKKGNKKTYSAVKDGTSSTMMTCVLKESDGAIFEQTNILTKVLQCPDTTTAKSTDNSGEFSAIRCQCAAKCPAGRK
jgi:hypothetical protein